MTLIKEIQHESLHELCAKVTTFNALINNIFVKCLALDFNQAMKDDMFGSSNWIIVSFINTNSEPQTGHIK